MNNTQGDCQIALIWSQSEADFKNLSNQILIAMFFSYFDMYQRCYYTFWWKTWHWQTYLVDHVLRNRRVKNPYNQSSCWNYFCVRILYLFDLHQSNLKNVFISTSFKRSNNVHFYHFSNRWIIISISVSFVSKNR